MNRNAAFLFAPPQLRTQLEAVLRENGELAERLMQARGQPRLLFGWVHTGATDGAHTQRLEKLPTCLTEQIPPAVRCRWRLSSRLRRWTHPTKWSAAAPKLSASMRRRQRRRQRQPSTTVERWRSTARGSAGWTALELGCCVHMQAWHPAVSNAFAVLKDSTTLSCAHGSMPWHVWPLS